MKLLIKLILFFTIILNSFIVSYAKEETLIIFDSSVSMMDVLENEPKYITAVNSAKKVLNSISDEREIGLRTIGMSMNSISLDIFFDNSAFCNATNLAVPIKNNNIDNIKNALDQLMPLGVTPLTYSLDKAINNDFSSSSNLKHIILITDGGESCNQNPCTYIKEVMSIRKDIKIDVIAIGVNSENYNQLKCLTEATSGILINANNVEDITKAFEKFLRNPTPTGLTPTKNELKTPIINYSNMINYKNYIIEIDN